MKVLKMFMIAITLTGCAHTFSGDELGTELEDIPEFESLVGSGILHQYGPSIENTKNKALLSFKKNFSVASRSDCEALVLTSMSEIVLTVAKCDEKPGYEICGKADNECIIEFKTKKTGNALHLINDGQYVDDDIRHTVKFYNDKIIYQIQEESCLISYPHGCIINGFSWVDQYTYIYTFPQN
ncbi:MAG: hypothetical protein ACJAYN_001364 [Bermanella sp.]|jgi:hypothetical protein